MAARRCSSPTGISPVTSVWQLSGEDGVDDEQHFGMHEIELGRGEEEDAREK